MDRAFGGRWSRPVQYRRQRVERRRLPARRLHLSENEAQRASALINVAERSRRDARRPGGATAVSPYYWRCPVGSIGSRCRERRACQDSKAVAVAALPAAGWPSATKRRYTLGARRRRRLVDARRRCG